MNFSSITNFSWSGSWDWLVIFVFLAIAFIYGLSMGRNRIAIVILGTYFSFLLTKYFPWSGLSFAGIKGVPASTAQIFIFLAIILGFYFLIPHSALGSAMRLRGRGKGNWWQALILSLLQIGLTVAIVINFLSDKIIAGLSPLAKTIFIGPLPFFLWLLLPILAIMFLRRRRYEVEE
ncbi:hypothetical protein KJ853_03885 [Patescibacteria group bacterium]|nr:hypothetical protein [Patescibacteria group bacterium]